jgi:hypothetical protein
MQARSKAAPAPLILACGRAGLSPICPWGGAGASPRPLIPGAQHVPQALRHPSACALCHGRLARPCRPCATGGWSARAAPRNDLSPSRFLGNSFALSQPYPAQEGVAPAAPRPSGQSRVSTEHNGVSSNPAHARETDFNLTIPPDCYNCHNTRPAGEPRDSSSVLSRAAAHGLLIFYPFKGSEKLSRRGPRGLPHGIAALPGTSCPVQSRSGKKLRRNSLPRRRVW